MIVGKLRSFGTAEDGVGDLIDEKEKGKGKGKEGNKIRMESNK